MPEPKDDLSNIPSSVLKQQRAADKAIGELAEPAPEPKIEAEPTPAPEPAPTPADPPAASPTDPPVVPAIDDSQNQSQWEHKYSVLQGKYNKEISGFREQIAELELSIQRQNKVIEDLNTNATAAPKDDGKGVEIGNLNPEDFDGWGKEMQDMVETVNSQSKLIKELTDRLRNTPDSGAPDSSLTDRMDAFEQEIGKTRSEKYAEALDKTIKGDWRKINTDAKFIAWLNQIDPISSQPRMVFLRHAASELQGLQVASIFNEYIESAGAGQAASSFVDDIPSGDGGGDLTFEAGKGAVNEAQLKKAQQDHIQGRITEEEYDKIYSAFQKELRRQKQA